MPMKRRRAAIQNVLIALACCCSGVYPASAQTWAPTRPVELIVPAGKGGGADQMARLLQSIVEQHRLMPQRLEVINMSGAAGGEGFLAIKEARGDPHKLIITLSNLFTTPLSTGVPFNWKDLTAVAMLALDQFVLWVHAESPHTTAKDFLSAVKSAGPGRYKMGGTGAKQEDHIVTVALERATGAKFSYVPFKGGGEVAVQLVGKHIDASVNNPIEAVRQWRDGKLRPLCVFDAQRMPYKERVTGQQGWGDIPACKEAGVPVDYLMLRGIFAAPDAPKEAIAYFLDVLRKVRATPEWAKFMANGAFNTSAMEGAEFTAWLERAEATHRTLMQQAGFLAR
jgi:putative tricarboxylic transport membrane protein